MYPLTMTRLTVRMFTSSGGGCRVFGVELRVQLEDVLAVTEEVHEDRVLDVAFYPIVALIVHIVFLPIRHPGLFGSALNGALCMHGMGSGGTYGALCVGSGGCSWPSFVHFLGIIAIAGSHIGARVRLNTNIYIEYQTYHVVVNHWLTTKR